MSHFDWGTASIRDVLGHFGESLTLFGERATPHAPAIGEAVLCTCCFPCNPLGAFLLNLMWGGDASSYAWFVACPLEAPHHLQSPHAV
jgi:hypothetical protein